MLKAATVMDADAILAFLGKGIIPVRIGSYIHAYGFDKDFVKYWISYTDENISAVVSLFENTVLLHAEENCDTDEIKTFISMLSYSSVSCEEEVASRFSFQNAVIKQGYRFSGGENVFLTENLDENNLKSAYKLICESIPNSFSDAKDAYLSFLSDYTYRARRSLARGKCICENNKVISCAVTSAETPEEALLSGVATDKTLRNNGCGKRTVLSLADELLKCNKTIYVIALNESAQRFYEHIGFVKDKKIAYIERETDV